ncbi:MAG TPA: LysR family transcriptional regulator [Anaeromyxobacteraceae bacterium]|nr:LysR family transcriptional regulator [Anaeromyxobacteraceae bacterium]
MDVHRLRTFQALSETLHFRHAAERLGITQSAVSQQIASLEKDLGATLFERIGRRVYLTPAGEVLAREAVKVLSTLSRAREAVGAVSTGNAGRLRVGASTTPGIYLLPGVLGRFRADFPLVQLDFRIANSSRIEALAVANDFDLGVCGFRPTHEELFETELGEDRIIAVAAPALVGKTRRIRPGDLAHWPLVAREPGSATRTAVERSLASLGVELVPAFELPSPEAIVRAVEAGLGYAFVSERAATDGIETGRLVEVRVQQLDVRRGLFAVYHRDKQVTPPMRELMDLLRARLRQSDKSA